MKKARKLIIALLLVAALFAISAEAIDEPIWFGEAETLSVARATSTTISEGTYFIQNRKYQRFAQIDNDDSSNNYKTDGAVIEQFPLDGETYQRWLITPLGNGYYKIMAKYTNLYLTVKSGDEHSNMGAIIQKSYTGAYNQQWKITKTKNGSYRIQARSSESCTKYDLTLSVNTQGIHSVNGLDLKQREYVDNTSYTDEWFLFGVGSEIGIVGIADSGHDHETWANSVLNSIAAKGDYSTVNCYLVSRMTFSKGITIMKQSKIFAFRGHGSGVPGASQIKLGESAYISSTSIYDFDTKTVLLDLSNVHIAVYTACETAYGGTGSSARNIVTASIKAGADFAIGFEDSIDCAPASEWQEAFFEYLVTESVASAAIKATNKCSSARNGISSCRVLSKNG